MTALVCCLGLWAGSAASEANGQTASRPRLAMSRVRGNASWGAEILERALVAAFSDALELVPPAAFEDAQRQASGGRGQPPRLSKEGLAAAGASLGVPYVLTVEISRKGYLYTAHAELIGTASAAIGMDFRSGYYVPTTEAADRAQRIARTTITKLGVLLAKEAPLTGTSTRAEPPALVADAAPSRDDSIFQDAELGDEVAGEGGRDSEIFGTGLEGPGGVEEAERRLSEMETKVKAGGRLFLRMDYFVLDANVGDTSRLRSPNLLDLYVDARLNDRVRAYSQARVSHDFTLVEGPPTALGPAPAKTRLLLDQLWLKFDVAHTVYVTVGRQRIKWGVGRFFNPTDFLNPAQRDPLAVFDERLGVSLAKLHLPIEFLSWNFYALLVFDDADLLKRVGGALRAELLLGPAEVSLSATARKSGPLRLGADVSTGLSIFDFRAEAALVHNTDRPHYEGRFDPSTGELPSLADKKGNWIPALVLSLEAAFKYADQSAFIVGAEYFYNGAGYTDSRLAPFLLHQDATNRATCSGLDCPAPAFQALNLGRHYGGAYVMLPEPFGWRDNTFITSFIGNLSDRSFLARLDYQATLLSFLALSVYGQVHFGRVGEFRLAFDVPPVASIPSLSGGASLVAPVADFGAGLSITF